jgi:hypothetical protein
MKYLFTFVFTLFTILYTIGQNKQAYIIYKKNGKKTTYEQMLKQIQKSEIVLFGEQHNSSIAHWLQIEVLKDCFSKRKLMLGAEMFESDNQQALNNYLIASITQKGLDTLARLWPNYKTDYAPLVNFAKDSHLVFIATNIPRKYASLVYKRGFESLDSISSSEKNWLAPLPIAYDSTLPGYVQMLAMFEGHGGANLPKAQAAKDATMAHFILKNYMANNLFIHFNGAFHSDHFEGILWYLKKQSPNYKYLTISTVTQADVSKLDKENIDKADYIICVDEDVTTTY